VERRGGDCSIKHGPLTRRDLRRRDYPWTVLVQGVNLHVPAADRLMRRFDFVPWARLDDLMISYASDGGGVGPHFDAYDVFLIQAHGRRRWRIGAQRDRTLLENVPLRILRNFTPRQEWLLEPGDLLYLPPQYAHDGVAVDECVTYSVGFRTPLVQEVATGFLAFLEERLDLPGRYRDPGLKLTRHPGEISVAMRKQIKTMLKRVRWTDSNIDEFLGCYLSEPKAHVVFRAPAAPLSMRAFLRHADRHGVKLSEKAQLLFSAARFFLNGESIQVPASDREALRTLADRRALPTLSAWSEAARQRAYDWYCQGALLVAEAA
jgi:50S ribosomal protein L16 3-hydroxylase